MQDTLIIEGSHMGMKANRALMHGGCWKGWCSYKDSQLQALKVHKIENFFGSEFEFYTIHC